MGIKKYMIEFADIFIKVLLVGIVMTYLSSLIIHGSGAVNWETCFSYAIILGILFPANNHRKKKQEEK
jgi:hypothetical protein